MTTHGTDIVSTLQTALIASVGRHRFDLWFGSNTRLVLDERCLVVIVPNQFFLDWLRSNFRSHLQDACQEVLGGEFSVSFRIDPKLADHADEAKPSHDNGHVHGRQVAADASGGKPKMVNRAKAESPRPHCHNSKPMPQRRFADLGSFAAGHANTLAIASAQMVARRSSQFSPLLFYGPTGVGKTHLLEGIWTAWRASAERRMAIYLSAEQFTTLFLGALHGGGLPSFRRKYRGVDLLLIDDLQFFAGKRTTQIELLHTIDTLMREGRQLVFAADRPPTQLAELGPELSTRLQSGMVCRVEPPDFAARLEIVTRFAERMKVKLPEDVRQYIATRLDSHGRELSGAVCQLQAVGEALGRPIDLPLAEQALADLIRASARIVRLPDIEKAVCEVFGLSPHTLQSEEKIQRVSHPRMLAMWLARKHTRAALSEIGQFFGGRSHSTVISAQKRVDGWMAAGHDLPAARHTVSIDEAIRQVERYLSAG